MCIPRPCSRATVFIPFALAFLTLGLTLFLLRATPPTATISSVPIAQARLAPGTDALLKQTASHLSKLLGGVRVGGFPPFRPPDDDERFKEKIKHRSYNAQEFDYWLKEVNKFLAELAKKNPNMSLREMLAKNGATRAEIDEYLLSLQRVYQLAEQSERVGGVSPLTVDALKALFLRLGVLS